MWRQRARGAGWRHSVTDGERLTDGNQHTDG
jgi:hypothetical protein